MTSATKPIGIFDSGIGGLTVAHALAQCLPQEDLIYFGDTAHLPYGDKSAATIQSYATKIAELLLAKQCKLILVACHSASAAAFEAVQTYVGEKALVMNVIDPVITLLQTQYAAKRIGLIGTRQTVNSGVYQKKISALNLDIALSAYPTNLLAAAIEEFGDHPILDALLSTYLQHPHLKNIHALILACTHYPLVKQSIARHYGHTIDVIDPSEIVAAQVKMALTERNLHHPGGLGHKHFYVSDYTESFAANAKLFFGEQVKLEHYALWE